MALQNQKKQRGRRGLWSRRLLLCALIFQFCFASLPTTLFAFSTVSSLGDEGDVSAGPAVPPPVSLSDVGEESAGVAELPDVVSPALPVPAADTPSSELTGNVPASASAFLGDEAGSSIAPEPTSATATFGDEGVPIALPTSPIVSAPQVAGSLGDETGDATPVVSAPNTASEEVSSMASDSSLGDESSIVSAQSVIASLGDEGSGAVTASDTATSFGDEGGVVATPTGVASLGDGNSVISAPRVAGTEEAGGVPSTSSSLGDEGDIVLAPQVGDGDIVANPRTLSSLGDEDGSEVSAPDTATSFGDEGGVVASPTGTVSLGDEGGTVVSPQTETSLGDEGDVVSAPRVIASLGDENGIVSASQTVSSLGDENNVVSAPGVISSLGDEGTGVVSAPIVAVVSLGDKGSVVQPPTDVCSNVAGNQATLPSGYTQNADGTCTQEVDQCTNIDGVQNTVPNGFNRNSDGSCTEQSGGVSTPTDVCSNIAGNQATLPSGYTPNADGTCTPPVVVVDVCSNVTGDQATLPSGYTQNADGTCTPTGGGGVIPVDVCSNLGGNQTTLPSGYAQNADGTCTAPVVVVPPFDVCSNIAGNQATVPSGFTESGGICTGPVSSGGGGTTGGGGGGGGAYALLIVNSAARQSCEGISMQWFTNQSAQSRVLVGTQSVTTLSTSTPLMGYSFEVGTSTLNTNHTFTIPALTGVTYYLRPVSAIPGYAPVIGTEVRFTYVSDPLCSTGGADERVASTVACPYITDYMRKGRENDLNQVIRLQIFLKYKEGIEVPISGTFDDATERGVHTFQNKYRSDILDPWGPDTASSGYVFVLTKWKINQLMCGGDTVRPTVTQVRPTVQSVRNNTIPEIGSVKINVEQDVTPTSTPEEPFIIGIATSSPNIAGAITSFVGDECSFFKGKNILSNLILLLPRVVYCMLNPLFR